MSRHPQPLDVTRLATDADWPLIDALHSRCSPDNLLLRWGRTYLNRRDLDHLLSHGTCWITFDADCAVALTAVGPVSREEGVVDLGLQVADSHQRRGIGIALARHAAQYSRERGAHTLSAYTAASNHPMLRLLGRLGPTRHTRDGTHLDVRIPLSAIRP